MKSGRSFGVILCILFIPIFLTSCVEKRAVVYSGSSLETMISASKKAISDVGFRVVPKDREDGAIVGEYDDANICCSLMHPEIVEIAIKVRPASGNSSGSETEVYVKNSFDVFKDLIMAIKNEISDAKIVIPE